MAHYDIVKSSARGFWEGGYRPDENRAALKDLHGVARLIKRCIGGPVTVNGIIGKRHDELGWQLPVIQTSHSG